MNYDEIFEKTLDFLYSERSKIKVQFHITANFALKSIFIITEDGKAVAKLDIYNDEKNTFYLSVLDVVPESRQIGIGKRLLSLSEDLSKHLGAKYLALRVEKGTWTDLWCSRHEYKEDYGADYISFIDRRKKL